MCNYVAYNRFINFVFLHLYANNFLRHLVDAILWGNWIVRPLSYRILVRTLVDAQRLKFVNISLSISV